MTAMTTRSPERKCKDYERWWGDLCVDKNLKDEWLVRLNDLQAFTMVGICEGHCDRRPGSSGRFPHINLRLKEQLLPGLANRWEELRLAILNEVNRLFQIGDTYIDMELKFKLRAGRGRLIYREDLTLRMRSFWARDSEEMDTETYNWFQESVGRVAKLDGIVLEWHRANKEA
jgi:hypothetical protein